jgi:hypothetical protein
MYNFCSPAAKFTSLGCGSVSAVHRATSISIVTIRQGIQELNAPEQYVASQRIREPGSKKKITVKQPYLLGALQVHLESSTCGDPISNTKTELSVRCVEDKKQYKKGIKISDKEFANVKIKNMIFTVSGTILLKTIFDRLFTHYP